MTLSINYLYVFLIFKKARVKFSNGRAMNLLYVFSTMSKKQAAIPLRTPKVFHIFSVVRLLYISAAGFLFLKPSIYIAFFWMKRIVAKIRQRSKPTLD